ncbi:hypothetical protein JRO89_XS11G0054600 [Xanthoceras sorbifolium]|uniref:Uncharacterized protein n=1 Tax=Xanthoceras sorbifolium TaxID=99658 RepID=A0ABQ8HET6_9ROSI|nr:hypothetical protein JRO89_XS11G0054600 [Xanthoceras sorbifolium]
MVEHKADQKQGGFIFDSSKLQKQPNLPTEFVWPEEDLAHPNPEELDAPLIDLDGLVRGDEKAIIIAAEQVRRACLNHGFFQIINHGVDTSLIQAAQQEMDAVFKLPLDKKLSISQKPSSLAGQDYVSLGRVYQKFCEEMKKVSEMIFELLAISLGLEDHLHYKKYFEDGKSLMRVNSYPSCKNAEMALGTGPHFRPRPDAFVIHIGDTFVALSNGKYKSCMHRAVVNTGKERQVFFVSPKEDKVVRPPQDLVCGEDQQRKYSDFTWSDMMQYTQKHHRVDGDALKCFVDYHIMSSKLPLSN